jgi:hypothetical protein
MQVWLATGHLEQACSEWGVANPVGNKMASPSIGSCPFPLKICTDVENVYSYNICFGFCDSLRASISRADNSLLCGSASPTISLIAHTLQLEILRYFAR